MWRYEPRDSKVCVIAVVHCKGGCVIAIAGCCVFVNELQQGP